MIADRQLHSRQLLQPLYPDAEMADYDDLVDGGNLVPSWEETHLLKLEVTNQPVNELFNPHWQPKGRALELQPTIQRRFYSPIVLWRAKDGKIRTWSAFSFKFLLGAKFPHWATTIDFVRWRGMKAILRVYDVESVGNEEPFDPKGIFVSVDVTDWTTGVVNHP